MTVKLIEIEPGRWRVDKPCRLVARSDFPLPHVISDQMEPTEQVDGRHYTSKRAFRAVGRSLGLTEVGNERFKPKSRSTELKPTRDQRRRQIREAVARYKSGDRSAK
jgi:hypothetical protein